MFVCEVCGCACVCVCVCKRRWMRVCATPATLLFLLACQLLPHDTGADKRRRNKHRVTNPDQARHPVPSVPRLPRKTTADASLCHACHAPVPLGLSTTAPTTPVQTSAGETNTGRQIRTKRATQCHLSHACHAK